MYSAIKSKVAVWNSQGMELRFREYFYTQMMFKTSTLISSLQYQGHEIKNNNEFVQWLSG